MLCTEVGFRKAYFVDGVIVAKFEVIPAVGHAMAEDAEGLAAFSLAGVCGAVAVCGWTV
jgi:hypothetical protein